MTAMIDTNQLNQVFVDGHQVAAQLQTNWPAICAGALWVRTELKAFNAWARGVVEYSIAHGGVLQMGIKFFWNPPAK
jgi:hypothetical protein